MHKIFQEEKCLLILKKTQSSFTQKEWLLTPISPNQWGKTKAWEKIHALPFVCKPSKQSNHKTIKFVYKISIPIEFPFH